MRKPSAQVLLVVPFLVVFLAFRGSYQSGHLDTPAKGAVVLPLVVADVSAESLVVPPTSLRRAAHTLHQRAV